MSKHHLILHLIGALSLARSLSNWTNFHLKPCPFGWFFFCQGTYTACMWTNTTQPNLLFAYRTEIKISWIKLFTFQFGYFSFFTAFSLHPSVCCERMVNLNWVKEIFYAMQFVNVCGLSNSFVLFTSNNWIITILITRNAFSKKKSYSNIPFKLNTCVCVCERAVR